MQPEGVLFLDDRRPCYGHLGHKDFKRKNNNNNNNNKKAKQNKKKAARVPFSTTLTRITERELEINKQTKETNFVRKKA